MKSKTSITLSEEVFSALDKIVGKNGNRSELIEKAIRQYLLRKDRALRDERDLEILNKNADLLNDEAADVLCYQVKT